MCFMWKNVVSTDLWSIHTYETENYAKMTAVLLLITVEELVP